MRVLDGLMVVLRRMWGAGGWPVRSFMVSTVLYALWLIASLIWHFPWQISVTGFGLVVLLVCLMWVYLAVKLWLLNRRVIREMKLAEIIRDRPMDEWPQEAFEMLADTIVAHLRMKQRLDEEHDA